MGAWFYEWEDTSDRFSTGVPDLSRYVECRATTKKQVREEWREYLAAFPDIAKRKPKIRVWRISYKEVKV